MSKKKTKELSRKMWAPVIWDGTKRVPDLQTLSPTRAGAEEVSNYPAVPVLVSWDPPLRVRGKQEMLVWVMQQKPCVVNLKSTRVVGCRVMAEGPVALGQGVQGFVVRAPGTGHEFIVEAGSGAVVGTSLQEVREEIAELPQGYLKQLLWDNQTEAAKVVIVPVRYFWACLERLADVP